MQDEEVPCLPIHLGVQIGERRLRIISWVSHGRQIPTDILLGRCVCVALALAADHDLWSRDATV